MTATLFALPESFRWAQGRINGSIGKHFDKAAKNFNLS